MAVATPSSRADSGSAWPPPAPAASTCGVAHITIPADIQDQEGDARSKRNVPSHSNEARAARARVPDVADLREAADILNRGKNICDPCRPGRAAGDRRARNRGRHGPRSARALVDPLEPPMPPKVTRERAVKFAESLVRGEPNREKIALTAVADRVRELV